MSHHDCTFPCLAHLLDTIDSNPLARSAIQNCKTFLQNKGRVQATPPWNDEIERKCITK